MKTLKLLCSAVATVAIAHSAQAAKTAKAVLQNSDQTLRFVYDETDYGTKNQDWFAVSDTDDGARPLWLDWRYDITKVVFDSSFAGCKPKTCSNWFRGCSKLATVEGISCLDTSASASFMSMFNGCTSLTSLDLSSLVTAKVTNMFCMFDCCHELTSLDLSGFDTANVTDMGVMFGYCRALTSLDLSGFDTAKVMNMDNMFVDCGSLKTIAVSDRFVTTQGPSAEGMFESCWELVGGKGTEFEADQADATCARIDGGPSAPGYFTDRYALPEGLYGVRFIANGGLGTMADLICEPDKVYNLAKCAFTTPFGKLFVGWKSSKNGKLYDEGVLVFSLAEPGEWVTMTAVWK